MSELTPIDPHKVYKCLGWYGYHFGIAQKLGIPREQSCGLCVRQEACKVLTRVATKKKLPREYAQFEKYRAKFGYLVAQERMWADTNGLMDNPVSYVYIQNEADGLIGRSPGAWFKTVR